MKPCANFNAVKKIDESFNIKSTYKRVMCPYCDKLHIDKLLKEKTKEVENE